MCVQSNSEVSMFCHQCGTDMPEDDSRYCRKCGNPLVQPRGPNVALTAEPVGPALLESPESSAPSRWRAPLWVEGLPQDLPPAPGKMVVRERRRRKLRKAWYKRLGAMLTGSTGNVLKLFGIAVVAILVLLMMRG